MLLDALTTFSHSPASRGDDHKKYKVQAQFGVALSMYHAFGLLKNHGMKPCYNFLKTFSEKEVNEKVSEIRFFLMFRPRLGIRTL